MKACADCRNYQPLAQHVAVVPQLVDKRFRVGHSVFLFLIGCSNLPLALSISMSTLSVHTAR